MMVIIIIMGPKLIGGGIKQRMEEEEVGYWGVNYEEDTYKKCEGIIL